jgi:glycosyltransferase involved in cell wall biosynthesis
MNIGIDGNEANVKDRVGVNKYAFEMLLGLKKLNESRSNPHDLIVYLKNEPQEDLPKESNYFRYKILGGRRVWILSKLTPYLFSNPEKIDVLFSPSHYTPPFLTIPRVCSIMDLGYLEFTGQFEKKVFWQLKYWTAISIFASKQVLTISESSKQDIVRHYTWASKKITVTPLSHDLSEKDFEVSEKDVRRVKNKYSIVADYVLYVGTLKPSKNIEGLVAAFAKLTSKNSLQLVMAGKKGWMYTSMFNLVKKLGIEKRVVFTDYVTDDDKMALRKGAKVFVQPSFWEGFGIDTLSCMALGVPVVASNVGSLAEVIGNAGVVIDPYNIDDIARGLSKVLNMSQKEYNNQITAGINQAKKFSWQNCAELTMETLKNAI